MCNKKHPAKFYSFVTRKSITNLKTGDSIFVVKLICLHNYSLKKIKNRKIPYTITVLPAFIQPYARKTTQTIVSISEQYINNEITTQQEAAFFMGSESSNSFNRYYSRIANRIDAWNISLAKKISDSTGTSDYQKAPYIQKTFKQKWEDFITHVNTYYTAIDRLPTGLVVLKENRVCVILALFCMSIKGLGP